jgi:hypothetical protein
MESKLRTTCVLALSLWFAPAVLFAHHGSALYDTSKRIWSRQSLRIGCGQIPIASSSLTSRTTRETSCTGTPRLAIRRT